MTEAAQVMIFDPGDYASGLRRIVSLAIDLFVALTLVAIPISVSTALWVSPETLQIKDLAKRQRLIHEEIGAERYNVTLAITLLLPLAYHIGMRLTPIGTLGYLLTWTRLIGADGRRPAARQILKRFGLSLIGCFTFGAIYIPCFTGKRRQALHDLLAGTWIVRRRAGGGRPAQLIYKTRLLGTYPLTYIDVEPLGEQHVDTDPHKADDATAASPNDAGADRHEPAKS